MGWAHKLGGIEALWIPKVGHSVLARLIGVSDMAPAYWLSGERLSKGTMAFAHLNSRHFCLSLYTTGAFQAATLVLELRGNESELVSLCVGSLRRTA